MNARPLAILLALAAATPNAGAQDGAAPPDAAAAVPTYTLQDCIRIGLERSIPLANARRDEQIARARIGQVRAQTLPSLAVNGSYIRLDEAPPPQVELGPEGLQDNYGVSADARQLLYSGGSVSAALKAAKDYRLFSEQEVARQTAALKRDIAKAFYDVLFARAAVDVAGKSVRQLEDFEKQARLKFEHETLSEFDWLSAQVKLANERPRLVQARNNLALARTAFRNLLYLEETEFELSGELAYEAAEPDLDALRQAGLERRPEVRQARADIDLYTADIRAARGGYQPQLYAVASYAGANPDPHVPSEDEWEWGWNAGLTATWSLLDGGLRRGLVLEKALRKVKAQADLDNLERAIAMEVESAYLTLNNAREVVMGTQDSVALAEKALQIARLRYDRGLSTYLEFTDGNLALSSARLIHLEALRGYLKALADLRYACAADDLPARHAEGAGAPAAESVQPEVNP